MKKNSWFYSFIAFLPSLADANQMHRDYVAKEKMRVITQSIEDSPVIGMTLYGFGAVALFIGLVVLIFFLIMLLKR